MYCLGHLKPSGAFAKPGGSKQDSTECLEPWYLLWAASLLLASAQPQLLPMVFVDSGEQVQNQGGSLGCGTVHSASVEYSKLKG